MNLRMTLPPAVGGVGTCPLLLAGFEFLYCLLKECLLVIRHVFKAGLEDGIVVFHIDVCG